MASRGWIYSSVGVVALAVWAFAPAPASPPLEAPRNARAQGITMASSRPSSPLPAVLERPALEAASRDPFALVAPPAPAVIAPKPVQAAPPPPSPPPLNLRFTGRMTAPDGSQIVFVAVGDTTLSLSVGQTLPNGYRVNAIHDRAVELSYLPMNFNTRFDLPAPPTYEIR
ncbi:hypothetical protein PMI15_01765 [Polaromonas sp. CF318]|nr:hypothetical protein PMI15_01765 [Polaromonas sp. CF318]